MDNFVLNDFEFNKENISDLKKELDILNLENYNLQQIQPDASFSSSFVTTDNRVVTEESPEKDEQILNTTDDNSNNNNNDNRETDDDENNISSNDSNNNNIIINTDDDNLKDITNDENNNSKLPLDLSTLCKLESLTHEVPFLINCKLQDGKHLKVWQCKTCLKEFGHQYTLMRHLPTHTDERKFQCNTCGKAFRQMSTLSQHRAIHSHERPYICEVCQKTFNRVSTLISHRKTHTGVKPHRCHMCNKAFHQKGNLRNHIFTHTNERPYKCEDCGKGFNQMSNLMCHKLKSHQQPKFFCVICGKSFTKRVSLRNHEQYEHSTGLPATAIDTSLADDQKLSNAIFVEPIKTKAMEIAIESNQVPFALLRPLTGIPVLVRVLPAGNDKQMLVPASAEDLKKHGQISVTPRTSNSSDNNTVAAAGDNADDDSKNFIGSTVQIRIPVVATVIQQSNEKGHMSMAVVSPGPGDQSTKGPIRQNTESVNYITESTTRTEPSEIFPSIEDAIIPGEDSTDLIMNGGNVFSL